MEPSGRTTRAAHKISREAVADRLHAACVGDDISADGGVLLARIRGIEETFLLRGVLHIDEQRAGLTGDGLVLVVDGEDLVHTHHGHHDAAVFAVGAAGETGACAADNDRNVVLVAVLPGLVTAPVDVELPEVRDEDLPVLTEDIRHRTEKGIHRLLHVLDRKSRLKKPLSPYSFFLLKVLMVNGLNG